MCLALLRHCISSLQEIVPKLFLHEMHLISESSAVDQVYRAPHESKTSLVYFAKVYKVDLEAVINAGLYQNRHEIKKQHHGRFQIFWHRWIRKSSMSSDLKTDLACVS